MTTAFATVYGDSISDAQQPYGHGVWFDEVCAHYGWVRKGGGVSPVDNFRAAIAGLSLMAIPSSPVPQHGVDGVPTRLQPYMIANADNYLCIALGSNDYFRADNVYNDAKFGQSIDIMMSAIHLMPTQPKLIFWVGMSDFPDHGVNNINTFPLSWAANTTIAWQKIDAMTRTKCLQYNMIYVSMFDIPLGFLPDGTHPTTPDADNYYANQTIATIDPYITVGEQADPIWNCGRKAF